MNSKRKWLSCFSQMPLVFIVDLKPVTVTLSNMFCLKIWTNTLSFLFSSRVFTDPIHLDRARMTKPPPPTVDEELHTLNAEELAGGRNSCFILTHDKPLPNQCPVPHKHTLQWGDGLHSLQWNFPPDVDTRVRMCECFSKSAKNLKIDTHDYFNFHCKTQLINENQP